MKHTALDMIMAAGIAFSVALGGFRSFAQDCEDVRQEVLRLHIPANSDSEEDQRIKLLLRDYILEEYSAQLSCEESPEAAAETVQQLLPELEKSCNGFLADHGAEYSARAELVEMYFTTRVYDNVTLPAGEYTALRITLGSGEGHNWWCVMFPPLCIPAASDVKNDAEESLPDTLIAKNEPQTVQVRFAVFEFFKWLMSGCT